MPISISDQFDGGAIRVLRAERASEIELALRPDSHAPDIRQWFYFRVQGVRGAACRLRIRDVAAAAFPDGWSGYQACASYDRTNWFRVPTRYDGDSLTIDHTPERDSIYFAYFEPYSWERHLDVLGSIAADSRVHVAELGRTLDGRPIDLVAIGDPSARKRVWVIARQHPGETMAQWFAEGLMEAMLDDANPLARRLLQDAVMYVVPNMNPDGSARGNLRTNAAGANLNREWMQPTAQRSPEVLVVRDKLHETGCDLFLDVHGDEGLPYIFAAGCEMLEGFTAKQQEAQAAFLKSYCEASPDFQTGYGYEAGKYRQEVLQLASKYVGHHFGCVSLTLEMPFKDNALLPQPETGWNGVRSKRLGAAALQPILRTLGGQ